MTSVRSILFAVLLAFAGSAAAQQAIEAQMTPEEFRAAGLDKLSADELARLNAWLNRTIVAESEKAAAVAEKQVRDDARGFFHFGSSEPVVARMTGEFRGFGKNREYTLDNGQVWKQVDDTTLVSGRLDSPTVRITPSLVGNAWFFAVEGYNKRAKVQRIK